MGPIILHGLLFLVDVLRLDRQRDTAPLAVHSGKPRFDFLADFQQQAGIFHAITRQLGSPQLTVDSVSQIDDRSFGVHLSHHTVDDAALRVLGDVRGERILRQLLDPQADALTLRIDGQYHGIDLLRLLIAAHRLLAGHVPRDVRQMHQAVDAAGKSDENAEIGDRLDLAADLVAAVVVLGELLPGIGLALLHAETDAAALLVDVEHHDLDFLSYMHHLGGIDVLVGPIHLRDVNQAFHTFFDFDEAAVIGDVGDLAEQTRIGRIAPRDVLPRIRAQLLEPERHALALAIELQNAHIDLFADLDDFGRMLDALPSHVGDGQQSVDAAQVDESAVVGEILHHTLDRRTLLQIIQQRGTLCAVFLLDDRAARHDHIIAFLIELDDLEFERLVLQVRRIAHRAHIDQGTRQERAHVVDLDGETALDPAGDDADDHFLLFEGRFEPRPRSGAFGLFARQTGFS